MARERIGWIDWVRALGACVVVLLHCLVSTRLTIALDQPRAFAYLLVDIVLCRWAVPAFFMISGLLLLDPARELTWRHALRHASRMAGALATFGVVFALMEETWDALRAGTGLSPMLLPRAVWDVLSLRTWDHLWYVYALLGVYLLAPAVRSIQAWLGEKGFVALTASLFCAVLLVPLALQVTVPNTLVGLACFCVGGCLRGRRLTPAVVAVGLGSLVFMVGSMAAGFAAGNVRSDLFLQGSGFACAYGVLVVLAIRRVAGDTALPAGGAVANLALDSFGIYLIHPLFIHVALLAVDPARFPPLLFELGLFCVVLAASVVSTRLLRRLPLMRDIL